MLFFCFYLFLTLQLHRHAFVVVTFISTLKRILSLMSGPFVMNNSLLYQDGTVKKSPYFSERIIFKVEMKVTTTKA